MSANSPRKYRHNWTSQEDREQIDLVEVAWALSGPPVRQSGDTYYWKCPFHDPDNHPSFRITRGSVWWNCDPCSLFGDAANLVMRILDISFPAALDYLFGDPAFLADENTPNKSRETNPSGTSGILSEPDAQRLVIAAKRFLLSPDGSLALKYLTNERCLTLETISKHHLGYADHLWVPKKDGRKISLTGWVIPSLDERGQLAAVKLRKKIVVNNEDKYLTVFKDPSRFVCYPNVKAIQPGRPLIVVEGEFDALVVQQELGDGASAVTLGSASETPDWRFHCHMLGSWPKYLALDNDPAGENSSTSRWSGFFKRVKPPGHYKDWTDAR